LLNKESKKDIEKVLLEHSPFLLFSFPLVFSFSFLILLSLHSSSFVCSHCLVVVQAAASQSNQMLQVRSSWLQDTSKHLQVMLTAEVRDSWMECGTRKGAERKHSMCSIFHNHTLPFFLPPQF
jgi:hypothetical protein